MARRAMTGFARGRKEDDMTTRRSMMRAAAAVIGALFLTCTSGAAAETEPALRKVDNRLVCMVNDMDMRTEQIPVPVEGKTYYGCCRECKERLAKDATSRTAVDPVSGAQVDKATAVIGAKPDGTVLYFESDETFAAYLERSSKKS
jgi:YHS domain-containing protein